ncbi:MAG: hypothetical protein JWQ40_4403 [Segetibacter sp.]|nr:hypothetical protein [Segetibacter sp.]
MKDLYKCSILFFWFFIFCCNCIFSQSNVNSDSILGYKSVKAGAEYKRSSFHNWLMGENYRKDWTTPVRVPVFLLDTAKGGLKAYKSGGGNQTKSLHVKTAGGKEYALRSVNKSLAKVLPENFLNTFIEDIVNDEVSMSHPYAAATIPVMAHNAKIYHTYPQYVFLPQQASLDTFNKKFGNTLYLFEQRLSGSWKEADNLGNFAKFIDTWELLNKLQGSNLYEVDQRLFVRSRLFDMFINDWDRHEDQWEWGLVETRDQKIYKPVPQDRDQAYFKYNGVLLKLLISAARLKYFQAFDNTLPDVNHYNYEERNLDRFFANRLCLNDWQSIAKDLQQLLTDEVIQSSIKRLPPEIFAVTGKEIISKLQSRRQHLVEYATTYYRFIAREVEVVGSKEEELFEVKRVNDNETAVNVYRISKRGKEASPFYSRIFKTGETREVRLYGLSGKDVYIINGAVNKGINIRIIGGDDKDSIIDQSAVSSGNRKTHLYDNHDNSVITGKETRLHLSSDTAIHGFKYFSYLYDKNSVGPALNFNNEDRLYVGVNAKLMHHAWRKLPFAYHHAVGLNYSISQNAFSAVYHGIIPELIGKWDLLLNGNYDAVRWTKFFGLGNETPFLTNDNDFYRLRSEEWSASVGINHKFKHNDITVSTFFQSIRLINDQERFVSKTYTPAFPAIYNVNNFGGAKISYKFVHVNDSVVPVKGFVFSGNVTYANNISQSNSSFTDYSARLQFYIPLLPKLSLAVRTAAQTMAGNPQLYQYASVGGPETIRGYRLDRFWGKTAFFDANELRYITKVRSYIFNGKAGLLAFFDQGRVWMPGEKSNTWHSGYGGGILLAPLDKVQIVVTYGISEELKLFQLRVGKSF